jgi:polyferredoxin
MPRPEQRDAAGTPSRQAEWPAPPREPLIAIVVPSHLGRIPVEIIGKILMALGLILTLIGSVWFLVAAFRESVWWAFVCLFVPFGSLIFLTKHLDKVGKPVLIQFAGVVSMLFGACMTER